jgi:hypothetical protein
MATDIIKIIMKGNAHSYGTVRLLTAALIIVVCGFAVLCGWNIIEFSRAQARVASHEAAADTLRPWIGFPGLSVAALDASLKDETAATGPANLKARTRQLARLLAAKPFSPAGWVSLAGTWLAAGEPDKRVLAALTMSRLTGPNEGEVMWQRGIFGLLEWDILPPAAQSRAARDIAGPLTAGIVNDTGMKIAERVLDGKSVDTRAQISRLLRKQGVSSAQLDRLGLNGP